MSHHLPLAGTRRFGPDFGHFITEWQESRLKWSGTLSSILGLVSHDEFLTSAVEFFIRGQEMEKIEEG